MAHAAPASGTSGTRLSGKHRTSGMLDTSRSPRTSHARPSNASLVLPALAAVVYGLWAAGIERDAGPITTGNVLFGVVSGVVVGVVCFALHQASRRMAREVRAIAWTSFAGIAFGFLYAQTGATVLRSVIMSLAVAGGVFAFVFYRYYTTED